MIISRLNIAPCILVFFILSFYQSVFAGTNVSARIEGAHIKISGLLFDDVIHESSAEFDVVRDTALRALSDAERVDTCCHFHRENTSQWLDITFREAFFITVGQHKLLIRDMHILWSDQQPTTIVVNKVLEYQVNNASEHITHLANWSSNKREAKKNPLLTLTQ